MFLVNLIRNGEFSILSKLIPPTLFMTTNLPPVRVCHPSSCKYSGQQIPRKAENEDPQLAISVYIPGNPSYRLPVRRGAFIPLYTPMFKDEQGMETIAKYLTCIDEFYRLETDSDIASRTTAIVQQLPPELERFARQNSLSINVRLIREIRPESFECRSLQAPRRELYHWYFNPYDAYTFQVDPARWKRNMPIANVLKRTSKSYGRFCGVATRYDKIFDLSNLFNTISKLLGTRLEVHVADVLRLLYAVDYRVLTWRFKDIPPLHNIDPRDSTLVKIRDGIFEGVKVLATCRNRIALTAIGYKIRDSYLLKVECDWNGLIGEFICEHANIVSNTSSTPNVLEQLYRFLTVNTVLFNYVNFHAISDLGVQALIRPLLSTDLVLKVANVYYDISGSTLVDIACCKSANDVAEEVVRRMIDVLDKLKRKEPRALVIKYLIAGERSLTSKRLDDTLKELKNEANDVVKSLADALNYGNGSISWQHRALMSTLLHTIVHHMISRIGVRSRVSLDYLTEIRVSENLLQIAETVSGGIKAIETAGRFWGSARDFTEILDDFVLTLGSCIIGSAEDLVYYTLVNELIIGRTSDLNAAKSKLSETAILLGTIFSPVELYEAEKFYDAVIDEAKKIATIGRLQKPVDLIEEVVRVRFECEKQLKRSCTPDELLVYVLKKLKSLPALESIIKTMFAKTISSRTKLYNLLSNIYGVSPIDLLSEKFVNDLVDALNGKANALTNGLVGKGGQKVNDLGRALLIVVKLIRSVILRLALKGCDDVCGYCYVNPVSCVHGAPWVQKSSLSRRLLKLYATHVLNKKLLSSSITDIKKIIGKIATSSRSTYLVAPG